MTKDTFRQGAPVSADLSDSADAWDERSNNSFQIVRNTWSSRRRSQALSAIAWYVGKFNFIIGIVIIGVATAILVLFGKRRDSSNALLATGLVPVVLGAFSLLFTRRPSRQDFD